MTTQASIFRALLAAAVLVALQVGSASASEYPVLFIHGFCSNSGTWDGMFDNLSRRRFGDKLIQAYAAADGKVYARNGPLPTELRSFAIDFYDPGGQTFDKVAVANISISDKVRQLKTVIDGIKGATGAPKVVVVAHSMGGLVARAYVQGWGLTSSGRLVTYGDDVARVVTIDTPHQGSGLGSIPTDLTPWDRLCLTTATVNKSEMLPDSGFLHSINSERPWPSDTKMDAVASYYQNPPFPSAGDTDGVVTRESQDIRTVSSYWATNPNIQAYLQRLSVPRLPVLHTAVLGLNVTSSLVASLIAETDSDPPSSPSRCATTAISIGAVISGQLTTADCFAPHRSSQRGDLYSFNAVAGQRLHISMSAGSLDDPYLVLVGPTGAIVAEDDDSGPVDDPLIDVVAPTTGVYVVESTTYDSFSYEGAYLYGLGTYSLRVEAGAVAPVCVPVDISIGSSADGALTGADCDAPHRQGAKADLYRFFARAGQRVLIRMTAPAIDAYLMLTSGTGTMMAQDDDSAGALNAEIAVTMPATGTYVIEATSYSPDERGTYRIQVSSP